MTVPARQVLAVAIACAAACGAPPAAPEPPRPPAPAPAAIAAPPPDAAVSEDERLAAIQKAMNELDEAAQQCWAVAATERFDIEGELAVQIDIAAAGSQVAVVRDTVRNPTLVGCVKKLLATYRFAPPLDGQAIQLPFKFRAPDGQNTIDRALVAWRAQPSGAGKVGVAVLLDESNTGNDAASMFEVAITAGATTGLRRADRAEIWYFLDDAQVVTGGVQKVSVGDVLQIPAGGAREILGRTPTAGVRAVVVVTPGGREGAARAGALPTPKVSPSNATYSFTLLQHKRDARRLDFQPPPPQPGFSYVSALTVAVPAGDTTAEHSHAIDTELWYVLSGTGSLTVDGVALPVSSTSVVQIPRNTRHAFTATTDFRALQIVFHPAAPARAKVRP